MEMKKYKLDEICKLSSAKRIFESEYVKIGIPFIRGQEISDKSVLDKNAKFECYISSERYDEIKKEYGVPQKGDILMTAVGTIGNLVVLKNDRQFYFKDGNIIQFSNFSKGVDSEFIALYMQTSFFRKQLERQLIGAVQKALTMVMLNKMEVYLPDLPTQQKIAAVLSALDDKIALNRRINAKLEQMAKRLYDHWFVQFDFPSENGKPYKASGGKMVWNETLKREIPEGWEVKSLFEAADVIYGFPYATEPFDEDIEHSEKPFSVIRIRDISDNSISAKTDEMVDEKYQTKRNDLLIGMDGYFHMNFWSRDGDYVNQRITRVRETDISPLLIYHQIKPFIKHKEEMAKGSTVGHLSDKDMKQLFILIPNDESISNRFNGILNMLTANQCESARLTALRGKLLPLLMNGQVEVC